MSVEYRLYYDEQGYPLIYVSVPSSTTELPDISGKYIVVDHYDFQCKNHSVKVVNGKIVGLEDSVIKQKFKTA